MSDNDILKELKTIRTRLDGIEARASIANLMARYSNYFTSGEGEKIYRELWAGRQEDVCLEFGASGKYIGIKKVASFYQKDKIPGKMEWHIHSNPEIELAEDLQHAKGVWYSIGVEVDAGDYSSEKPEAGTLREDLLDMEKDGRRYSSDWVIQKFSVNFILEEGWKIHKLHIYDTARCPFNEDWVSFAEKRFSLDGPRIEALFTSNIPFGPDEVPENLAFKPTERHFQYTHRTPPEELE